MSTSELLFAPRARHGDIVAYAPFLQRARSGDSTSDPVARGALGAYLVLRLLDRVLGDPAGVDADGVRWQLQSTQRYVQELQASEPEPAHLLGLVEAVTLDPAQRNPVLRLSLIAYAFYLEQEGRYEEALEVLNVASATHEQSRLPSSEFVSVALQIARLNRHLARWDEAVRCYRAAGAQALQNSDVRAAFLARLGEANVRRGQGDLPGARASVEAVIHDAVEAGETDVEARAYHDLAAVLDRMGLPHEAAAAGFRAFELYQDPADRCRALGDLGVFLRALGAVEAARYAFETVLREAQGWPVRINALIGLMELEAGAGNRIGFQRRMNEAKALESQMAPSMGVDFRFNAGLGLARFGYTERARTYLRSAQALSEEYRLHAWSFRVERVLRDLADCPESLAGARLPEPTATAELRGVTEGLRRYALAATG